MIVLDEQLLGRDIERDIARWYRGLVQFVVDLRPHSVIKDDGIPQLLRLQPQPTFVTINERDFWHKIRLDPQYCVVCFPLPDSRVRELPASLRSLFHLKEFRSKAQRMGKILRVTSEEIRYYSVKERQERIISRSQQ
jgi:hypothetical protein